MLSQNLHHPVSADLAGFVLSAAESSAAFHRGNSVEVGNILMGFESNKISKSGTAFYRCFTHRSETSVAGAGNRNRRIPRTAGSPCCCTRPSWTVVAAAVASSAVGESGEVDLISESLLCINQNHFT